MPILLEDIYNLVTFDPELRLVKQVRSNERIPSLQELHRSYTSLVKSFELYTRHVFLAALRRRGFLRFTVEIAGISAKFVDISCVLKVMAAAPAVGVAIGKPK